VLLLLSPEYLTSAWCEMEREWALKTLGSRPLSNIVPVIVRDPDGHVVARTAAGRMSGYLLAPAGYASEIAVLSGPRLLRAIEAGPSLSAHRTSWPAPRRLSAKQLLALVEHSGILGRGGAGFPFGRKLATAVHSGRRREVIVNAAEGEPGSAKDSALMITAPHLVLDGAELVAGALGIKTIRVVVPRERAAVQVAVDDAVADRGDFRYEVYETGGGFVGGQAYAVMELIEGRENLPVSSWQPAAVSGLRGRPTLLSNAETYAQVATLHQLGPTVYAREGTDEEPGTTLVTVAGDGPGGVVIEVPHGTTIVAIRYADGVVMAGDRRATSGNLISSRTMEKVLPADRHSGVAIAGAAGPAMEMVKLFQLQLEHYEKVEGSFLSLEGKANQLSMMVRGNLPAAMQGMVVVPIFAGFDERRGQGRLFSYDVTGGRYEERDQVATGSGSLHAGTVIKVGYRAGMDRDAAVELCVKALWVAADADSATGGPDPLRGIYPVVATITAAGYERVPDDELRTRFEAVAAEMQP
jgi:proteasome beta subunit